MRHAKYALIGLIFFIGSQPVGAQTPIAIVDPPVADFGLNKDETFQRMIISTTRPNASLNLLNIVVKQPRNDVVAFPTGNTSLTPATPVDIVVTVKPSAVAGNIAAKVLVSFINNGPALPDLPLNAKTTVSLPVTGASVCDPNQPGCNLPGPYCLIDKNTEEHIFFPTPNFKMRALPAIETHFRKHLDAFQDYELPIMQFADQLGLSPFITANTLACTNSCPAGCCQCQVCAPNIKFHKPSNEANHATFVWDAGPAQGASITAIEPASGTTVEIKLPAKIRGVANVAPSHSEFFFQDESKPQVRMTNAGGPIFEGALICLNTSAFGGVLRRLVPGSDKPRLNVRIDEP